MKRRAFVLALPGAALAQTVTCPPGQRPVAVTGESQVAAIEFSLTLPMRGGVKLKLPWVTGTNAWKCEPVPPPPPPPPPAPNPVPPRIGHQIATWRDWMLVTSGSNVLGGVLRLQAVDGASVACGLDCRGMYALASIPAALDGFPHTAIIVEDLVVESWGAPFTASQMTVAGGVFSTLLATPEAFAATTGALNSER